MVKRGELSEGSKLILSRVSYLATLNNNNFAANQVPDVLLNERTQKKMFFPNIHWNSEEFKDLGNLHYERRLPVKYQPLPSELGSDRKGITDSEFKLLATAGVPPVKRWKKKYDEIIFNISASLGEKLEDKYN